MRWMPPPWEGIHPAFPEQTDDTFKLARNHPVQPVAGPFGLALATALRLGHLISGRQWKAGTSLASLGVATLGVSLIRGMQDSEPRKAAQALLDKEGIKMPYPSYFKSTARFSLDDAGLMGVLVGAIVAALRKPSQLGAAASSFRVLGASSVGGFASTIAYSVSVDRGKAKAAFETSVRQQTAGAAVYRRIMQTDPPAILYLDAANAVHGHGFTLNGEDASPYLAEGALSAILSASINRAEKPKESSSAQESPQKDVSQELKTALLEFAEAVGTADSPEEHEFVEEEPGTFAFQAFKHTDGTINYSPQRDFMWRPASSVEGIKTLEDFIANQQEIRAKCVQSAEYTWRLLARWESRYARTIKEPDSSVKPHRVDFVLKVCQLLSSTHQTMYEAIGVNDWLIAQSRKIILQLQTDGAWQPESKPASFDPKTYRPVALLNVVQSHRAFIERMGREENIENWAATKVLEDEIHRQVDSPGAPEGGAKDDFEI